MSKGYLCNRTQVNKIFSANEIIHAAFSLTPKIKFYTKSITNVIFSILIKDFFSYQPKQFPFALNVYRIVMEQKWQYCLKQIIHAPFSLTSRMKFDTESITNVIFCIVSRASLIWSEVSWIDKCTLASKFSITSSETNNSYNYLMQLDVLYSLKYT